VRGILSISTNSCVASLKPTRTKVDVYSYLVFEVRQHHGPGFPSRERPLQVPYRERSAPLAELDVLGLPCTMGSGGTPSI
jgi:hypothetical protein